MRSRQRLIALDRYDPSVTVSVLMNGSPDLSLASLATASPEQIKAMIGLLPPQLLSNVRAALSIETAATIESTGSPTPNVSTNEVTEKKTELPPFPTGAVDVHVDTPPPAPSQQQSQQSQQESVPDFAMRPPPHFERLPPDYSLYDPLRCQGRVILGVPITSIELPKQTSSGRALVIRLLHPTLVVDNMGQLFEARTGQDILLEVSHWLRALVRRAHDEKHVGEVWLRPGELRKAVGGDVIPDWDIWYGRLFPRDQFMKGGG